MIEKFDEFKEAVSNDFLIKKEKLMLPDALNDPSPKKLRVFCLSIWNNGLSAEDADVFKEFFNPLNQNIGIENIISGYELDKLEPLRNFILGNTTKPRENSIVKLLAVLIGFQPRPFKKWWEINYGSTNDNRREIIAEENPSADNAGEKQAEIDLEESGNRRKEKKIEVQPIPGVKPGLWSKFKKPALYGIVVFLTTIGAYQLADSFDHECMYWSIDRYIPIDCGIKIEGVEIIPLDKELIKNFRKIMESDTLTKHALEKVWYVKVTADSAEFYTGPGFYPLDTDKKLKPLTQYMLDKYVLNKQKGQ